MLGIVLSILTLGAHHPTPKPFWDGREWTCPVHYSVYAIESRALAGKKNFTVCVKEKVFPYVHTVENEDNLHMNTDGRAY